MYPYTTRPSTGAFSTKPCENFSHPSHAFKQHKRSAHHKWLEKKLSDKSVSVYEQMVQGVEKVNFYNSVQFILRRNIFACLLSVHNTISLSHHEQRCLMRLFREILLPLSGNINDYAVNI